MIVVYQADFWIGSPELTGRKPLALKELRQLTARVCACCARGALEIRQSGGDVARVNQSPDSLPLDKSGRP